MYTTLPIKAAMIPSQLSCIGTPGGIGNARLMADRRSAMAQPIK